MFPFMESKREGQDNKSLLQETANNTESEPSTNSTLNPEDVENSDDASVTTIPENEDADSIDESFELSSEMILKLLMALIMLCLTHLS
ncbi:hypothetical protein MGH68_02735 [Erysipelothrix sp. D19-032]